MFMGLTIANIGGVPAATWLGETIGWRMSFLATAGLGVIAMLGLWFSLPKGSAGARPDVKRELSVLVRPQVLTALLTTVLGGGRDVHALYLHFAGIAAHQRGDAAVRDGDAGADRRRFLDRQLPRRQVRRPFRRARR